MKRREFTILEYHVYTGIGSRETPHEVLGLMTVLGWQLALDGWTLRSGAAPGADTAFERGALAALKEEGVVRPEIYLPWKGFENRDSAYSNDPSDRAMELAQKFHPAWGSLTQGMRKLHARNVHQILGHNVDAPHLSTFVICWTKDGKGGGGTGQALRIARHYGIKEVYDLANREDQDKMREWLRPGPSVHNA
jgi:hypothetical protein